MCWCKHIRGVPVILSKSQPEGKFLTEGHFRPYLSTFSWQSASLLPRNREQTCIVSCVVHQSSENRLLLNFHLSRAQNLNQIDWWQFWVRFMMLSKHPSLPPLPPPPPKKKTKSNVRERDRRIRWCFQTAPRPNHGRDRASTDMHMNSMPAW